jgi:hypothetical protein
MQIFDMGSYAVTTAQRSNNTISTMDVTEVI